MRQRGDGLTLRKGKKKDTWWLEFVHFGERHRVRIGSSINRTVARELAAVNRAAILKGEAGIGGKKRKDISFENAVEAFQEWAKANKRPGTAAFYGYCFQALRKSFKGKMLSQVHPFLVEKHKQERLKEGFRVAVNRELAALSALFNRCIEWGKFDGQNPRQDGQNQEGGGALEPVTVPERRRRGQAAWGSRGTTQDHYPAGASMQGCGSTPKP